PVLDAAKGARALEAYRKFRRQACVEFQKQGGERAAARLRALGLEDLPEDIQVRAFCDDIDNVGRAVASGALVSSGADEVLLDIDTLGQAQREYSLALMRDSGQGYRFVQNVADAAKFDARLRLVAPGRRDVLVLCDYSGIGGVYPGGCGFF